MRWESCLDTQSAGVLRAVFDGLISYLILTHPPIVQAYRREVLDVLGKVGGVVGRPAGVVAGRPPNVNCDFSWFGWVVSVCCGDRCGRGLRSA